MKHSRLGFGLVALVLLGGTLAWMFRAAPVTVETARIARGPFVLTVDEDGVTRVRDRYVVTAPVAGLLLRPSLRAGDAVKRGDKFAEAGMWDKAAVEYQAALKIKPGDTDVTIKLKKIAAKQSGEKLAHGKLLIARGEIEGGLAVIQQAVKLAPAQRREFARYLLDSLEPARDPFYANRAIEKAWEKELRRRVRDMRSGKSKPIPWEVVRRELWRRINASGKGRALDSRAPGHRRGR